jgi:general secretion pathway protein J
VNAQSDRGMTLIETLVALTLLALLSIGLIVTFRVAEHTYRAVTRVDSSAWDIVTTQRFLRQTLESAYPSRPHTGDLVAEYGIEGTTNTLTVTAPMPQSAGSMCFYRYNLAIDTSDRGARNFIVHWSPERTAVTAGATAGQSEVLLRRVDSIEWSYLEPPDIARGRLTAQWSSNWTSRAHPPLLVRLRVKFPAGDPRSWPELLIAPRVTDDAACSFDSVSQTCREEGS